MQVLSGLVLLALATTSQPSDEVLGLVLLPSSGWTAELREDLALGVAALPAALRPTRLRPLQVELHPEAAELGLGDAARTSGTDEGGRLHLYRYADTSDERASGPLTSLSAVDRERLWRRRAVVHAVIRTRDAHTGWSKRRDWRSIAGWTGTRPTLTYPWAFSRRAGMESPALDLATFAEELLVPAESLRSLNPERPSRSRADEAAELDDAVRCREPTKARFLDERLRELDPTWSPAQNCPALDAWARRESLPHFEVVFAFPSSNASQAVAGHVLLRLVRDGAAPGEDQMLQLAALVSPFEPPLTYVSRGLGGGFHGIFSVSSAADVRHEALNLEQRGLRRQRLRLSPTQRTRLMERIFELERVGYVTYRFFTANCASMLRFLLGPILGPQAPRAPLTPFEFPTQVMESLGPLLQGVETEESSLVQAAQARAVRAELSDSAPTALRHAVQGLATGDANERVEAYRALSAPLPRAQDPWRARVLLASLRAERATLDEATVARLQVERAAVLPGWKGPSSDDLIQARQRRLEQRLRPRALMEAELSELLLLDQLLRSAPRRELGAAERAAVERERTAVQVFEAVASAVAELPADALEAARAAERREQDAEQLEWARRAVPESGHGRWRIALGLTESGLPLLRLRAAVVDEELGDQRARGFGPRSAWRILDASVDLRAVPQPVHQASLAVLDVGSVALSGWGARGGLDYAFAGSAHEAAAAAGVLRVVGADRRLSNYVLLHAGARAGLRADPQASFVAYPRAALSTRLQLPGSFGNAVRLEAAYLPRLRVGSGTDFEQGVALAGSVQVRLGTLERLALTARLDVQVEWRETRGASGVAALGLDVD